ncbi:ferredoxin [Amycolatopsis rubida]|uniref:Ferredoxin n=1 Tax=Amycolatopsis rubida TaxID=112413 RepID=A0A1I5TMD3_9PSEU|nr:ferredoxin [Amycolatopsis rubida]SFP84190.1 Ferredoxin [Amycolatopsis rubida]
MRVNANSRTCAVSSLCVYRAPSVFSQDEDGHVVVLDHSPGEDVQDEVRRAARGCPTRSIEVVESDATGS